MEPGTSRSSSRTSRTPLDGRCLTAAAIGRHTSGSVHKRSTFSLLPQRFVETGTRVGEPRPLPDRTGPEAFLLAVSDATRRAKGRARVHAEHGHRLRARDARKAGARMRRLLVRQAIAECAPHGRLPSSPPHAAAEASLDAVAPAKAAGAGLVAREATGSLLDRIGAYMPVAAPSMPRRR